MTDASRTLQAQNLVADLTVCAATAGVALMERRSRAIADYWRSFAAVREPSELMALNLSYCTHALDDYQAAYAEGLKPVTSLSDPEAEAAAPAQAAAAA